MSKTIITIDNQLIDFLADTGQSLDNRLNKDLENLRSLFNIAANHNKNRIDLYVPFSVVCEIYNGKLKENNVNQLRKLIMCSFLKSTDSFYTKEDYSKKYKKLFNEFGEYFNFSKKNQKIDFQIIVESITVEAKILMTYDYPLIEKGKNQTIKKYIKILDPVGIEKYLEKNCKLYHNYSKK